MWTGSSPDDQRTDLVSSGGADGQGVGDEQRRVLLLHHVDAGNGNHHLEEPRGEVKHLNETVERRSSRHGKEPNLP